MHETNQAHPSGPRPPCQQEMQGGGESHIVTDLVTIMTGTAANGTSYLDSVGRVEGLDVTAYMRDDI